MNIEPSPIDSDAELMDRLRQDDGNVRTKAEREIYKRYTYLIRIGERQYRLDNESASSAYSDTILSLINNIVNNRFQSRSSLKSYVHQIFMNKCVDVIRKKTTKKGVIDFNTQEIDELTYMLPDQTRSAVQQLIDQHDHSMLYRLVSDLGDKCKQILLMFEDGFEDKDIALQMNYNSADVVKTTRLRCLDKLREKYFARKD